MERLSFTSSSSLLTASPRNPRDLQLPSSSLLRLPSRRNPRRLLVSVLSRRLPDGLLPKAAFERMPKQMFASISSSRGGGTETSSVGTSQFPVSPPASSIGSPLFWVGVGVALSALFSWVANFLKKYAMQQAMKSMMGQMSAQKGPFGNSGAFPSQPFPFPTAPATPPSSPPPTSPTSSPSQPAVSQPPVTVDVSATKVESASPAPTTMKEDKATTTESQKYGFVDVSPEEVSEAGSSEGFKYSKADSPTNGSAVKQETKTDGGEATDAAQSVTGKTPSISVDALEKMMEDPTVQKMVFPYLPEEMRNPATFKWMLQNPQYRQQLQEMLDGMSGNKEWDKQVMDSLKNFDLNSPEVKQQFEQVGLTPEEVISKIMANPDIAMSFQNPKVQAAIMDCSENPLNIQKYQDDKEVMDVFDKISKLFPGAPGF